MPPKKLNKKATQAAQAAAAPAPPTQPAAVAADALAPVAATTSTVKKGTKRGEAALLSITSKGFEALPGRSTKRAAADGPKPYKISRIQSGTKAKKGGQGTKNPKKSKASNAKKSSNKK
ncbi:hypothetical protein CAEBREN_13403 [Caenorhabditis brenneri]|uniref:Uncharacterized protein n=1 Tax=Caenorhabditis brenneri TaxID=135651 RepID=G0PA07_CAEBE|nr:hypothetical protein CAEBREN_13403 [Caenorhabditis brenneri]